MKVLHLFSDWKWTGPAEPVLNLCRELEKRGHEVLLAYRRPPLEVSDSIEKRVRETGIRATGQFRLNHALKLYNGFAVGDNLHDFIQLPRFFERKRFDIVNVHQTHGHVIGGLAARRSSHGILIIRTDHKRDPLKPTWGNRFLLKRYTDGLMTFSEISRKAYCDSYSFPVERTEKITPALDWKTIESRRPFRDMRQEFGIGGTDPVVGTVARFQRYRRTEILLRAIKLLAAEFPSIKGLLVGRSSQMKESVIKPMEQLGLGGQVVLAGYRTEDYFDTIAAMDIFVFLMAGSDGTGRAMREAMALGKPIVASNVGGITDLVAHGKNGFLVPPRNPKDLAKYIQILLEDKEKREKMGLAGKEMAVNFSDEIMVESISKMYNELLTKKNVFSS